MLGLVLIASFGVMGQDQRSECSKKIYELYDHAEERGNLYGKARVHFTLSKVDGDTHDKIASNYVAKSNNMDSYTGDLVEDILDNCLKNRWKK